MDNTVDWRSPAFRQNMAEKMQVKEICLEIMYCKSNNFFFVSLHFCAPHSNEALQSVGIMKNANEMENQVFQKVQTHEEYRTMIAKLLKHMQSKLP